MEEGREGMGGHIHYICTSPGRAEEEGFDGHNKHHPRRGEEGRDRMGGGTTIPREEWRKRGRGLRAISITPEESRKEGIGWGGGITIPREEWRKRGRGLRVISITRIINFSKKV